MQFHPPSNPYMAINNRYLHFRPSQRFYRQHFQSRTFSTRSECGPLVPKHANIPRHSIQQELTDSCAQLTATNTIDLSSEQWYHIERMSALMVWLRLYCEEIVGSVK
ncbi:hypothetical protein BFJ71_g5171 [Fusarium oxysporum]|nr:hypothetical protein BFJ71_g5171 [Fusarium oxysporum]